MKIKQEEFINNNFESQSETIIEKLIADKDLNREQAMKLWFRSKTYSEIVRRCITYISAMRAYTELEMELKNNGEWMRNPFE